MNEEGKNRLRGGDLQFRQFLRLLFLGAARSTKDGVKLVHDSRQKNTIRVVAPCDRRTSANRIYRRHFVRNRHAVVAKRIPFPDDRCVPLSLRNEVCDARRRGVKCVLLAAQAFWSRMTAVDP